MHYRRHLTDEFKALITSGGTLSCLAHSPALAASDPFAVDPHCRPGSTLSLYHGTTKLCDVKPGVNQGTVELSADPTYAAACGYIDLMREWNPGDLAKAEQERGLYSNYLRAAVDVAADANYRNKQEGYWQNRLSLVFGRWWQPGMEWLLIDREAVIAFDDSAQRNVIQRQIQDKYALVRSTLQNEDSSKWGKPAAANFGNECDFLAIGPDCELMCIELKVGANTSGIYWGPLQVAVYRDLFRSALPEITEDIKTMVRQKVECGLLPPDALKRLPKGEFRTVLPVLAVADPNDRSACWERLSEVVQRCPEARVDVVEIRNPNDPAPVGRC